MPLAKNIESLLRSRNEKGLKLLYTNYSGALYGISFRILNNQAFAEDALQQSFLKIWNNIHKFDNNKSSLYTWMVAIVRNTSLDIRRLKSFEKEEKTDTIDPHVHNTEEVIISTDKIDAVKLLEGLDEKYAFVIEYLYLRGYSQSALSEEFDIPLGTIKSRVKKGIDILRKTLTKEKKLFIGIFLLIVILLINVFLL